MLHSKCPEIDAKIPEKLHLTKMAFQPNEKSLVQLNRKLDSIADILEHPT